MLKIVFEALLYVLALYGLLNILRNALDRAQRNLRNIKPSYKLILTVKNQQDTIEGIIRGIFKDDLFRSKDTNASVLVIDKGSTDETVKILKKLQEVYDNLEVLQEAER